MLTEEWQSILETALARMFQDIKTVEVIHGEDKEQRYPELVPYMTAMKKMRLEELLIESDVGRMLVVKHSYEDVYAVVRYGDVAHAIDLSKLIRVVFSQRLGDSRINNKKYLSIHIVSMNLRRWERSIARVFGDRYASKLLATAMVGRDASAMSAENLSEIRAFISSALGECLIFEPEKVDK